MKDTKEYSLLEVIFMMKNTNKKLTFSRVNDEEFKIFKGKYGDIMCKCGRFVKPLPIFNYMQDLWRTCDD